MITRIFRISNPFHYVLFFTALLSLYIFQRYSNYIDFGSIDFFNETLALIFFLLTMFLLVFIITKNNLTQNNSFGALYFTLLIFLIPQALIDTKMIISNAFVLLSFRRIFSLESKQNLKKKYFDAAAWLTLAMLFYHWAILYYAPLLLTIIFVSYDRLKHFLVLFFGIIAVYVLGFLFHIILGMDLNLVHLEFPKHKFDFWSLSEISKAFVIIVFLIGLGAFLNLIINLIFKNNKYKMGFIVLSMMLLIGLIIPLINFDPSIGNALFLVFPLSVVAANFSEKESTFWLSNLLLLLIITLAFLKLGFNI